MMEQAVMLQSEIDRHIERIETPFGGDPDQFASEVSRQWLIAHAQEAFPRVLARAAMHGSPAIYDLLGKFAREEAIPLLTEALSAGGPNCGSAARALARHPQPVAGEALGAALNEPNLEVSIAAADGLLLRGEREFCPALAAKLDAQDDLLRYHVLQAAGLLGCVEKERLLSFIKHDDSDDVRTLAAALLHERRD